MASLLQPNERLRPCRVSPLHSDTIEPRGRLSHNRALLSCLNSDLSLPGFEMRSTTDDQSPLAGLRRYRSLSVAQPHSCERGHKGYRLNSRHSGGQVGIQRIPEIARSISPLWTIRTVAI